LTGYPTTSSGKYLIGMVVPVLRRGAIWVRVNTNVNVDDPVYFVYSAANPALQGNFQNVAGGIADLVPTGVFIKAGLAGGLAVVELNLPK
jgi:hypothetical protein